MALGKKTGGRKKGTPNKATAEGRSFWAQFVDQNWQAAVDAWNAIEDPASKFKCLLAAAEFAYPKLGRLEHTGEDGAPLQIEVVLQGKPPEEP